jgi:hypothetical protein
MQIYLKKMLLGWTWAPANLEAENALKRHTAGRFIPRLEAVGFLAGLL